MKQGWGLVVIHKGSSRWLHWDLYNDSVPAPIWGPKIRLCIITKHVAACFFGIWYLCKEGLGLKASESSHRYGCLLSSPVPSNFEGPSKSPSQSAAQLRAKITEITEAVMFIKNVYEMACKETWSIATPLIAADYSSHTGFFNRKGSSCYIQRHRIFSAGTFNVTC